jgi:IS1 family transposase
MATVEGIDSASPLKHNAQYGKRPQQLRPRRRRRRPGRGQLDPRHLPHDGRGPEHGDKLLLDLAVVCAKVSDEKMRDLPCRRLQIDEIWAFCYAKAKNVPEDKKGTFGYGDVWTFCAIDAETKLVPSWLVGSRDIGSATELMQDLAGRLACRVQITTDGLKAYIGAVEDAFGGEVDFAQLHKVYSAAPNGPETRYSPAECIGCEKRAVTGNPDRKHVSTSYVERQNLTMRMSMRRFTRLTNGHSKKVENHAAAVAVHFAYYNFCRAHMSLGKGATPAMAAGVEARKWEIADLIALLPDAEVKPRSK